MKEKAILVTGGSGFIGGYVYRYFKEKGYDVKNFDITGDENDTSFIQGSISNLELVKRAMEDRDIVFHFAGFSNINHVKDNPLSCVELNIIGTTNFLEAIRLKGAGKLILASSVYVHNEHGHLYTTSKVAAERICKNYTELYGISTTLIRLGTVYGEYSRHEDVISIFVKKMCNSETISIHGGGTQKRNFIHGLDISYACEKILLNNVFDETLILSGEKETSISELAGFLQKISPSLTISYDSAHTRSDDYLGDIGDVEETYRLLNWRPSIDLEQGVEMLRKYFQDHSIE